jgi:hypothetical protein
VAPVLVTEAIARRRRARSPRTACEAPWRRQRTASSSNGADANGQAAAAPKGKPRGPRKPHTARGSTAGAAVQEPARGSQRTGAGGNHLRRRGVNGVLFLSRRRNQCV